MMSFTAGSSPDDRRDVTAAERCVRGVHAILSPAGDGAVANRDGLHRGRHMDAVERPSAAGDVEYHQVVELHVAVMVQTPQRPLCGRDWGMTSAAAFAGRTLPVVA